MAEAHIIPHKTGEFSFSSFGGWLRLRWQSDDGLWRASYLSQDDVLGLARFLVNIAGQISPVRSVVGPLHCSFCGKSQQEVKKLIAGPSVFICDDCAVLCMEIVKEAADG